MPNPDNPTLDPWPYTSPGIPDELFEQLPGIPMTKRETRLLLLSQLRLEPDTLGYWSRNRHDSGGGGTSLPERENCRNRTR
jgi:hypothetical protein